MKIMKKERPKLKVFRSNKHLYCQLVEDGKTLVAAADFDLKRDAEFKEFLKEKLTKTKKAFLLGKLMAKKCLQKGIKKIAFDRGRYRYAGRIKALAEGAREGGLDF